MIKILIFHLLQDSLNNSNAIINWNPLKRCILMLILASALNLLWVVWKLYIIFHPSLHIFVNIDLLNKQVWVNLIFLTFLLALIYPCYKFRNSITAQKFLPYLCISIFVFTLIYDGYYVGIMSPATTCGAICIVAVGLVLFPRNTVYSILLPSFILLTYLMVQSIQGNIVYAPIFRLDMIGAQPYFNPFWLSSMLFFMTPVAICSFILFDLILCQWRNRELTYQKLSQIDPLTQLLNRRSINEYMLELQNNQTPHQSCCLILMDIDYFKNINDTYGHLKGDEVLFQVADLLKQYTRPEDLVGRYGGEEFIIITKTDDLDLAYQIAERCRIALMDLKVFAADTQIQITASFGIASWHPFHNIQETLNQADVALYQAKSTGRNLVKIAI